MTDIDIAKLKTEIFKDMKTQVDRKRQALVDGSLVINPQIFSDSNPNVFGPFYFSSAFARNPFISFGQARLNSDKVTNTTAQTTVDPTNHFVVQPYVSSWISDSGGIVGFYLGALALTVVPPSLSKHTITYHASGKSTAYKSDNNARWKQQYNPTSAPHLTTDAGYLENLS